MQCGSRPSGDKGKAADSPGSERHVHRAISAGVLALACMQDGRSSNTGSPVGGAAHTNRKPARVRPDREGGGVARSTADAG